MRMEQVSKSWYKRPFAPGLGTFKYRHKRTLAPGCVAPGCKKKRIPVWSRYPQIIKETGKV